MCSRTKPSGRLTQASWRHMACCWGAAGRHHSRRCESCPWSSLERTLFVRCLARIAASSGSNCLSSRYSSPLGLRAKRMHARGRSTAEQAACACQAQASGMINIVDSPHLFAFTRDSRYVRHCPPSASQSCLPLHRRGVAAEA